MSKFKTRKPTPGGRLVTRSQLQSVVNQIGAQLASALAKVQAENDLRLARIEKELGLSEPEAKPERTLALVPTHGSCAPPSFEVEAFTARAGEPKVPA